MNDKIKDKNDLLKTKTPMFKQLIEVIEVTKREITPDNLKSIYNFLLKKNAEPVTFVMEALVGLMRNMRRADTKSVELYIMKHEGFMIGLNRLDVKKLNSVYCEEALDKLTHKYNFMLGSEEFLIFEP